MPQDHSAHSSNNPPSEALLSTFAGDPEMDELVSMFVAEIPERASMLRTAHERSDLNTLRRLAHQLKGASGGYGFPSLGSKAGDLEAALTGMSADSTREELDKITALVNDLTNLCQRVRTH